MSRARWFYLFMSLSLAGQLVLGIVANIWDASTVDYVTAWWSTGNLAALLVWFIRDSRRRQREADRG